MSKFLLSSNGILLLALLGSEARADTPKLFDADPICDNVAEFRKELDKARPIHLRHPLLRSALADQNRWFGAVTGEMNAICEADKKFAAYLLAKERGKLQGQCKPAEEAASYDKEMLDHSEKALKNLKEKKEAFQKTGVRGVTESLPAIATKNADVVEDQAGDLGRIDFAVYCELLWLYPAEYLKKLKVGVITGCPALPQFNQAEAHDKKDPALFPTLLHRFELSIAYNTARRDKAAVAAAASLAKYQKCIAENPEVKPVTILGGKNAAKGQGSAVPSGKTPRAGSDITGTEEEKKKRKGD